MAGFIQSINLILIAVLSVSVLAEPDYQVKRGQMVLEIKQMAKGLLKLLRKRQPLGLLKQVKSN